MSALTPIAHAKPHSSGVQPALMNTDLLSREAESISLLLSLLVRILSFHHFFLNISSVDCDLSWFTILFSYVVSRRTISIYDITHFKF